MYVSNETESLCLTSVFDLVSWRRGQTTVAVSTYIRTLVRTTHCPSERATVSGKTDLLLRHEKSSKCTCTWYYVRFSGKFHFRFGFWLAKVPFRVLRHFTHKASVTSVDTEANAHCADWLMCVFVNELAPPDTRRQQGQCVQQCRRIMIDTLLCIMSKASKPKSFQHSWRKEFQWLRLTTKPGMQQFDYHHDFTK